ncbi:MAG: hypothetical protein F4X91_12045 [Nitrospinae bacterium]|nr:hypothetical protein [Nitrospinota bacterium]
MMVKDKYIHKLYAFALAAVFALVLAGCGGGGGTADTPDPGTTPEMCPEGHTGTPPNCMSPEQVEAAALAAAKTAAATAASNAASAVAAVMDNSGLAPEAYASAQAAVAVANQANSAAQAATTSAAAQAAQAIAESAASDAAKYAGMVTAAKEAADANAARMAANAVVKTKEDAIAAEAAQTTDAGLGGSDAPTTTDGSEGEYTLAISRDRMATKVSITVEGATNDDDEMFMQAMDLGGGTTMHSRAMEADDMGNVVEEVVIVSTDIEAPTAVPFAEFKVIAADGSETTPQVLDVSTDTTNDPQGGTATFEALGIVAGNLGMVKASRFTAPAGTVGTTDLSFQQAVADTPGTPADESRDAAEIAGTFNGSMGTYKCVATTAACTVTVNAMGVVSGVSNDNDWAFIPSMGATTDQPDYNYYHYGFWLKKTTDKDGVLTYNEVETFAGSSVDAVTNISAVVGTATYEGGATGVYVKNVYNSDRTLDTATSGHFTADVDLMAYFGGDDVAVSKQNSIEGTIDNFMLSGGEENKWSVALKSSATSTDGTHSGTAKGGGDGDGSFSSTFHGTADADNQPHTVVGEFNAMFTDGSVAGAFGARKMME